MAADGLEPEAEPAPVAAEDSLDVSLLSEDPPASLEPGVSAVAAELSGVAPELLGASLPAVPVDPDSPLPDSVDPDVPLAGDWADEESAAAARARSALLDATN